MIKVKGVSKTYNAYTRRANTVLDNANLELPDHGFVFIVGKSGIGKSTILNAIGGLISYQGEIDYGQEKLSIEKYRRSNISYIFQEFLLFDDKTVRDNIKLSLNVAGVYDEKEISRRVKMLLDATGLKINPKRRAGSLSLGQRQRVAIARALASDPKLILADEPTGNLDSKNGENIMKILKGLSASRLVLCVTHNLSIVAKYADYAYTLKDRTFQELDPSTLHGDADEGTASIIDTSGRTINAGEIAIRIYGDTKDKSEILLVEDNGRIFLSGENLTLVSKNEMELLLSRKEEAKKEAFEASDPSKDLKFEKTNDNAFLGSLRNFILSPKGKSKVGTRILRLVESLIPLAGAVMATVLMMFVEESLGNLSIDPYAYNTVMLLPDADEAVPLGGRISLTESQIYQIVSDEDSAVLDAPINPAYANFYGTTYLDATLNLAEPTATTYSNWTVQGGIRLADLSIYKKLPAIGLGKYELADNEILVDVSTITKQEEKRAYGDQPLAKILPGSHLRIGVEENGSSYRDYIIKDVVDVGLPMFFANPKTVANIRGAHQANNLSMIGNDFMTAYAYKNLGDFREIEFVNYDQVKNNPNYEIVLPDKLETYSNSKPWTILSPAAERFFPDRSFMNIQNNSFISKLSDPDAIVVCFRDYLNSSFITVDSRQAFYLALVPNYLNCNSVTEIPATYHGDHSTLRFHNHEDIKTHIRDTFDILVPSAFAELIADDPVEWETAITYASRANPVHGFYASCVDTYPCDDPFAPFVIPEEFYHLSNSYEGMSMAFEAKMTMSYIREAAYRGIYSGNRLLSSNPAKTKAYFDKHVKDYGFRAETSTEMRKSILWNAFFESYSPFLTAFYALIGVLVFTFVLDGFSNVNSRKAEIGTYRCLGRSRSSILGEEAVALFTRGLVWTALPLTILFGILSLFRLYYLDWWGWLLIPGFMALTLVFGLLPLAWLLRKKPMGIMHTLQ